MGILYRAVWSSEVKSESGRVIDDLKGCAAAWVQEDDNPAPLMEGKSEFNVSQERRREVEFREIGSSAFEVIVTDRVDDDPVEWVTEIRVVSDDEGRVHVLVQLSMSSDDLARRVEVGRPKVVNSLIKVSGKPMLGSSVLISGVQEVPHEGISILCDILADPKRALPLVVCAEPAGRHDGRWLKNAEMVAKRAEGVAVVVTLDHRATAAFKEMFGRLAIWDGGIRVYVPGVVTGNSEGWRHRYFLRSQLEACARQTVNKIVYHVTQLSTRRRVPDVFRIFGERSGLPLDAIEGMIPAKELTEARERWEFESELARGEQNSLEKELAAATGHLERLKESLKKEGRIDLFWGTEYAPETADPDDVQCASEAVLAAQAYLDRWLSIPSSAARELDDVDTAPEAYSWGNNMWRGLRALAAYAEECANGWNGGGFWEWCSSGRPLGWPATNKKLAMTESETVRNNPRFIRARIFEVDSAVDPSGSVKMLSHLKIAEGGGNLAPRVYFYDDTRGETKKVHVGFVGPHYLVPNKSTN